VRQRDLERALSNVPWHPEPKAELEQYRTPDRIAAELLLAAHADGAIAGKVVLDAGCGTGVFAIGAALLGATSVLAFDVDAASIESGRRCAHAADVAERIQFTVADIKEFEPDLKPDTVIMNPPFGAQKANKHADKVFLQRSLDWGASTTWFLAQEHTEAFLLAFSRDAKCTLERIALWDYPLQAQFGFHDKPMVARRVGGYRMART
jgi:putative methylase